MTTSALGGGIPGATTLPPGSRVPAPTPTSTAAPIVAPSGENSAGAGGVNVGLIGGVVGGVVGAIALGLGAFFIWFCRRKRGGKASSERLSSQIGEEEKPVGPGPGPEAGTSELARTSELAGMGMAKPPLWGGTPELQGHGQGAGAVSPLSNKEWDAKEGVAEAPGGWGVGSELHGSPSPRMQHTELQGSPRSAHGNASLHEAPNGQGQRQELHGSQGGFEMQAYPSSPDAARVTGPVYEMPAGYGGWDAHAR